MAKKLYRFEWDCGRQGSLEGVFVADADEVAAAVGLEIYFGEVLGKHSEIYGPLEAGEVTIISEEEGDIAVVERLFGSRVSGYCPLDYIDQS